MADGASQLDRLLKLIEHVYDAAQDERIWTEIASKIAQALDSTSTAIVGIAPQALEHISLTSNIEDAWIREYEAHYHQTDPWIGAGLRNGIGNLVVSNEIMPDSIFEKTEFYRDHIRHAEIFYMIGAIVPVSSNEYTVLGVHRPRECGVYDEEEKFLFSQFIPHLQRALQVRRRLSESEIIAGSALEALNRSRTAMLVVRDDCQIVFLNREAEDFCRANSVISIQRGRLVGGNGKITERLTALVHGAASAARGRGLVSGGTLAVQRSDRLPLTILVAPFRPARDGLGAGAPAAILFIRDPECVTPNALALRGLFGLTQTEAKIASEFSVGMTVEEVAATYGTTPNTIRVHLKNIFLKTGVNRQSQLVSVVLRSVAYVENS